MPLAGLAFVLMNVQRVQYKHVMIVLGQSHDVAFGRDLQAAAA